MNKKVIALVFSVLCLFAVFLPLAQGGDGLYVNVTHIGGLTYLLYLLPLVPGGLSLIAIYKGEIRYMKVWMIVAAVLGLCLSGLAIASGKGQIEYMANAFGNMKAMLKGFPGDGNAIAEQHQTAKASVGLGGMLLIIGYLGILLVSLFKSASKEVTTAIVVICLLAVGSIAQAEEPRPFGLIIGKATLQDAQVAIAKEGGKITNQGNRIISGDIANPNVTGLEVSGLPIPDLQNANFWFFNGVLSEVDYFFPASMDKQEFYRLSDQLKVKYGKPASYRAPNLSDGLAVWKSRGIEVRLAVAWVSSVTTVSYSNPSIVNKAKNNDKRVYAQQTKAKIKDQKGL